MDEQFSPQVGIRKIEPSVQGPIPGSSSLHNFSGRMGRMSEQARTRSQSAQTTESWISRFLQGLSTVSLFMIFFGFPLFFLSGTLQGIVFEKQMYFYFWLLLGLIGWVSRGIVTGELRIRRTPVDIPLLIFWGALAISSFLSVDKWHSVWGFFGDPSRGLLNTTALVLSFFFITSHVDAKRFRVLLVGVLASGLLVAIWTSFAFWGMHFLPESILKYMPLSLFGTIRSLSLFFGMLLPLFLVGFFLLFQIFQSRTWAFWVGLASISVGFLLSLYVLLAAYAYTPWFPILIGVSFVLIYVLAQVIHLGDRLNWMPMALFVVVLVFLMIGNQGNAFLSKKTTILPEVSLDSGSSWLIAKESLKERLMVGSGPATYGYNFSLYKPDQLNRGIQSDFRFYQGGNFILELLATLGIIGTFFFLVFLLVVVGVGFVGLSRGRERNKVFSLGTWAALLVFVVSLFWLPIDGPVLLYGFLILSLAIAILIEEGGISDSQLTLSLKASPKFALALAFTFMVASAGVAFLFAFLGKAFFADIRAGQAGRLTASSGLATDEALSDMGRSIALLPYEGRYYASLGQMYMTVVNKEAGKPESDRNLDLIKALVEKNAVPLVDEATRRMPNDVLVFEIAGQVYENVSLLAGSDPAVLAKTADIYHRALELEPKNSNFYVKLGLINRVLANRDDKKSDRENLLNEAKGYFQSALDRNPGFIPAYLNMGLVEDDLGNHDVAIEDFEKGLKIGPNIDLQFQLARALQIRGKDSDLDRAEKISLEALKRNDKNVNLLLNLGFIYEKKGNKDSAIGTYKKLLGVFEGDKYTDVRKQINTLIDNVASGKGNLTQSKSEIPETSRNAPTEIPSQTGNIPSPSNVLPSPVSPASTPEIPAPTQSGAGQ